MHVMRACVSNRQTDGELCLSFCLPVCLSLCPHRLTTRLLARPPIFLSVCLSVFSSICLSVSHVLYGCPHIHLCSCLSVSRLSVSCLSRLPICMYVYLPARSSDRPPAPQLPACLLTRPPARSTQPTHLTCHHKTGTCFTEISLKPAT